MYSIKCRDKIPTVWTHL